MGATEVVHGVSGSTMGLILGVYQEFIFSLRSVDRAAFRLLKNRQFGDFWSKINGNFLISILSGIAIGLVLLTKIVSYFLEDHFIALSSFLFGLVIISGILLLRKIKKWTVSAALAIVAGIAITYFLSWVAPLHTPDNSFLGFIAGICAGASLAFPGISSAFILLLVGKYQFIVISFSQVNLIVIGAFFLGCITGLWMASRFMYRMFADYYNATVALLAGLMLGALSKLWPWRTVFEYVTNSKGDQVPAYDMSVLPWKYVALTGKDPQVFLAILMMALGVFLVVLIEKIAAGLKLKAEHGKSFRADRTNR
jgi:putative membrane protein